MDVGQTVPDMVYILIEIISHVTKQVGSAVQTEVDFNWKKDIPVSDSEISLARTADPTTDSVLPSSNMRQAQPDLHDSIHKSRRIVSNSPNRSRAISLPNFPSYQFLII